MQIHLSTTEATEIIKTFFNLPDDAQIIIDGQMEKSDPLADEDPRMVEIVKRNGPLSKLWSIKEIRQQMGGGLNDVKIIVDRIVEKLLLENFWE